jgi:crotonobetaine/carnitine-CoA ligase
MVLIVPKESTAIELHGLFKYSVPALPYFAVPRSVEFRERLPGNAQKCVMYGTLREEAVTERTLDLAALGLCGEGREPTIHTREGK